MNQVVVEWKKDMKRGVAAGTVVSAFLGMVVLLGMLAFPWAALAWLFVLPLGGSIIVSAMRDYRRQMAVWLALPDEVRRAVDVLCAEERQQAYCRLLRGYLTPYGMLTREGFLPWERIVSISFWEKGRKFSRAADWWNFLSGVTALFGSMDPDYVDPESPAQCRVTVLEGEWARLCRIPLDPKSFENDEVDRLIAALKEASPVPLNIT